MIGYVQSESALLSLSFQKQTASVVSVDVPACRKIHLVYSPNATASDDYHKVAVVQQEDGRRIAIPYTKHFHDRDWSAWQDRCRWKDAFHVATIPEDMIAAHLSINGMPTAQVMMPVRGNVFLMSRPK